MKKTALVLLLVALGGCARRNLPVAHLPRPIPASAYQVQEGERFQVRLRLPAGHAWQLESPLETLDFTKGEEEGQQVFCWEAPRERFSGDRPFWLRLRGEGTDEVLAVTNRTADVRAPLLAGRIVLALPMILFPFGAALETTTLLAADAFLGVTRGRVILEKAGRPGWWALRLKAPRGADLSTLGVETPFEALEEEPKGEAGVRTWRVEEGRLMQKKPVLFLVRRGTERRLIVVTFWDRAIGSVAVHKL